VSDPPLEHFGLGLAAGENEGVEAGFVDKIKRSTRIVVANPLIYKTVINNDGRFLVIIKAREGLTRIPNIQHITHIHRHKPRLAILACYDANSGGRILEKC
jgi:hypothetical protein